MEELVGHRVERCDAGLLGVPPSGGAVRLVRMRAAEADTLVALLTAAADEHVEALLDIGTAVNGDAVLVLPELPTALGDLLVRGITPGEAVTILVPIAGTVARLHEQGVTHGSLGVQAVRFDQRGAPVLTRFERGVRRADVPGADAAFDAAAARDDAALRLLAIVVLRAAGAVAGPLVAEFAAGELAMAALPDALFALAEPAPVRLNLHGMEAEGEVPLPGRLVGPTPAGAVPRPVRRLPRLPPLPRLPDGSAIGSAVTALARRLRGVRLRVWAAAAMSLALLAGALVLLPGRGASGSPEPRAGATAVSPAAAPTPTTATPTTALPTPTRTATVPRPPQVVPAEPLAAARALLAARRSCLASGSARCLARVESAGSPIAIEDAAATAGAVEAVAVPEAALRLRSTSGGTAVLTAGDRTVLMVREPDGWRLRDAIGPPTTRSTARSGDAEG